MPVQAPHDTKVFQGLHSAGDSVQLPNGAVLRPGTPLHLMFMNLQQRGVEVENERDVEEMHHSMIHSLGISTGARESELPCEWLIYADRAAPDAPVVLGHFNSVDGFMRFWREIPVGDLQGVVSIRIFKSDYGPAPNYEGGKWTARAPKQHRMALWENLALYTIKEAMVDAMVFGCVMHANSPKPEADQLEVWVSGSAPGTEVRATALANELTFKLPCNLRFAFTEHAGCSMMTNAILNPSEHSYRADSDAGRPPSLASFGSSGGSAGAMFAHDPYQQQDRHTALSQVNALVGGNGQVYPKPPGGFNGWTPAAPQSLPGGTPSTTLAYYPPRPPAYPATHGGSKQAPHPGSPTHATIDGPQMEGMLRRATANILGYSHEDASHYPHHPHHHHHLPHHIPHHPHHPHPLFDPVNGSVVESELHSLQDAVSTIASQPEKKKKRNKPDKHQRERLRKKKAKQAAIEQAIREMAGVKCCECDLYLASIRCDECPHDRRQFCQECHAAIHKIGRRREHRQHIVFENPGAPPHADNERGEEEEEEEEEEGTLGDTEGGSSCGGCVNGGAPGRWADVPARSPGTVKKEKESKKDKEKEKKGWEEEYPFLLSFELLAEPFYQFVTRDVSSFSELRGFTEQDIRGICDEFFEQYNKDRVFTATKRGRAYADLISWRRGA